MQSPNRSTENTPQFNKKSSKEGLNGSIGNLVSKFNESQRDLNASRDSLGGAGTPRLIKRSDKISQLRESLLMSNAGAIESK